MNHGDVRRIHGGEDKAVLSDREFCLGYELADDSDTVLEVFGFCENELHVFPLLRGARYGYLKIVRVAQAGTLCLLLLGTSYYPFYKQHKPSRASIAIWLTGA